MSEKRTSNVHGSDTVFFDKYTVRYLEYRGAYAPVNCQFRATIW